jgi:plasmid stabilization system protein ParE
MIQAAIRLGNRLLARAFNLATMPQRFPFHDHRRGIRKMAPPPFLIFYACDEAARIVNVLHFLARCAAITGISLSGLEHEQDA